MRMSLFPFYSLRIALLDIEFVVVGCFPPAFENVCQFPMATVTFSERPTVIAVGVPLRHVPFHSGYFRMFVFSFRNLISLDVCYWGLTQCLEIGGFVFFTVFVKLSAIISLNALTAALSLLLGPQGMVLGLL